MLTGKILKSTTFWALLYWKYSHLIIWAKITYILSTTIIWGPIHYMHRCLRKSYDPIQRNYRDGSVDSYSNIFIKHSIYQNSKWKYPKYMLEKHNRKPRNYINSTHEIISFIKLIAFWCYITPCHWYNHILYLLKT